MQFSATSSPKTVFLILIPTFIWQSPIDVSCNVKESGKVILDSHPESGQPLPMPIPRLVDIHQRVHELFCGKVDTDIHTRVITVPAPPHYTGAQVTVQNL